MALTPNDIQNQKFESRMRGFDRSQVESFMSTVSEELTRVIGERNQLNEETESLRRQLGEYREREKTIGETLCALRELSEKMKDDARREGELILREARAKADALLDQSRSEAARLEGQISEIRMERDNFEDRLRLLIDEHQRLLIRRRQSAEWKVPVQVPVQVAVDSKKRAES